MNLILISYDLRVPGKDYSKLWEHLRSYGNYKKPLESVWLIKTNLTSVQVRDAAAEYVDKNDKIFATDITGQLSAWHGIPEDFSTWMLANWK